MNTTQRTALERSITHWEQNVRAETPDHVSHDANNCALCQMYRSNDCTDCPVSNKTKQMSCRGTPYADACRAYTKWQYHPSDKLAEAKYRIAAQAEVDFLKSLRTEPSPQEKAEEIASVLRMAGYQTVVTNKLYMSIKKSNEHPYKDIPYTSPEFEIMYDLVSYTGETD